MSLPKLPEGWRWNLTPDDNRTTVKLQQRKWWGWSTLEYKYAHKQYNSTAVEAIIQTAKEMWSKHAARHALSIEHTKAVDVLTGKEEALT